ncbi:hypothetical protein VTN49DRAFT_5580 [Thermomyces lanuginosus]|uniref:uncharacterized protein n=1 Tax=Thermomyces lanuginosus TaxID=5541 RepID=UPI0037440471
MVPITVPDNYWLPLAVGLGAMPLLATVHGTIVGRLRKPAKVPYPHCYATPEQCKNNPKAEQFNCAQRAHANYLENFPQTMLYTLVAGLRWPVASAVLGGAWVICRILFLQGYVYSGIPEGKGRYRGGLFWLLQGGLWAMAAFGVGLSLTNS